MHRHQWSDWQQIQSAAFTQSEKGQKHRYIRRVEHRCCIKCGALEEQVVVEEGERR